MRIILRKVFAFIVAFFVLAGLSQLFLFLGPALAGWTIYFLDIPPVGEQGIRTIESVGLIVNLAISLYVCFKVYKKIARPKKDIEAEE